MRVNLQKLRLEFVRRGVVRAADLARGAGVSQPTVSRALATFGDSLIRIGAGRGTRYALASPIENLGASWPLFLIGANGEPEQLGRLHALSNGGYWLDRGSPSWTTFSTEDFPGDVFPDIPWFLDDYRPQGFLGRAFARKHAAALGQDTNPVTWSGRIVIEGMLRFGGDFPGAFVLGRESLAEALASRPTAVTRGQRDQQYPELAERAMRGELVGSSAGGEQPKFVVETVDGGVRHLIVKFINVMDGPIAQRWADLLEAEHLAGTILAANGFPAAQSNILDAGGQRFLEVERFDRTPAGGRLPVVSLRAMAAAVLDGLGTPWPTLATSLREQSWLTSSDADLLTSGWNFGRLIANTDMHEGNVSLVFTSGRPVRLAPIYDMLPMAYRPDNQGGVPGVQESQLAICATSTDSPEKTMAADFWIQLASSPRISDPFREIASQHAAALA